jgi:hypothetical protein
MMQLGLILLGALLIALGLTAAIGPLRLLAGLVVVPIVTAIVAAIGAAVWIVVSL